MERGDKIIVFFNCKEKEPAIQFPCVSYNEPVNNSFVVFPKFLSVADFIILAGT